MSNSDLWQYVCMCWRKPLDLWLYLVHTFMNAFSSWPAIRYMLLQEISILCSILDTHNNKRKMCTSESKTLKPYYPNVNIEFWMSLSFQAKAQGPELLWSTNHSKLILVPTLIKPICFIQRYNMFTIRGFDYITQQGLKGRSEMGAFWVKHNQVKLGLYALLFSPLTSFNFVANVFIYRLIWLWLYQESACSDFPVIAQMNAVY